ncbi:uncharacterized protein LOC112463447 isoform X2 [Temnothorax curvispinosus]|uniref:Uncharacterized protein LOC112463447 isoform X2 n=1 Tax=Temnothorax curvispinosus TaxID=300111 RepID=A0A6J1QT38_9HYME|nr:uncharacterized protein LOC112463447 isoform X2 [Temnothorax curvispinosus]
MARQDNFVENFWDILETTHGVFIPNYIKNVMHFNNLDNPISFKKITESMISELENFAKNEMQDFIEPNADLKAYFGLFEKRPEKFRFMIGDKQLILALVEIVKKMPPDNWRLSKPSQVFLDEPSLKKAKLAVDKSNLQKNVLPLQSDQSSNVNLETERKKVETLIKNLNKKYTSNENVSEDIREKLKCSTKVKISVKDSYDENGLSKAFTYSACVTCPLCSILVNFTKVGSRWIISNFARHIETHKKSAGQKKAALSNVKSIKESFKISSDISNESQHTDDPTLAVIAEGTIVNNELVLSSVTRPVNITDTFLIDLTNNPMHDSILDSGRHSKSSDKTTNEDKPEQDSESIVKTVGMEESKRLTESFSASNKTVKNPTTHESLPSTSKSLNDVSKDVDSLYNEELNKIPSVWGESGEW